MSRIDEAVDARLAEIEELVASGATEMVGRARREYAGETPFERGRIVGRFGGGFTEMYPELRRAGLSPGQAAQAVRRGKGRPYDRLREAVADEISEYVPAERRAGRKTVPPHEGRGAYLRTHLFPYQSNMTVAHAKKIFARMMKLSRQRSLSLTEREQLRKASQVIRYEKRAGRNPITRQKARQILSEGRTGGRKLTLRQRGFFGARAAGLPRRPRANPAKPVRIGQIVELRYKRNVGAKPGYYKHTFRTRANVWIMPDGSVRIK